MILIEGGNLALSMLCNETPPVMMGFGMRFQVPKFFPNWKKKTFNVYIISFLYNFSWVTGRILHYDSMAYG